ncbi:bud emergence protein 1 [Recurvomyces mirabilis]|uniref:Bud emergence protein 1 n=1 Tax=Recurvomyces mirabilis TaxID=574656 RepID=A0AAE0WH52_9PEZI|nr:bud emergence protein 1 [Recurvomyces mirabilis]KAK5150789.1 bud emergence protein 1 [Recurvomyces mirabilis]
MKFRRSMKSDGNIKHDSAKPVQLSIPQKDAIAIEPPKKVIKALYDHNAPDNSDIYLSFSAGDFLHVLSRENDIDWYEACNPLANTRGLVPVKYFENVGKTTVRDSGDSSNSLSATHDSGYAEGATPGARSVGTSRSSTMNGSHGMDSRPPMPGHRASSSVSKMAGGIYGIVSYDFHAERPDELDAKEGEAIIVIAQSNPEWFVAKPITRLGGPGLIPVSFIELRDMATGKAIDDSTAAVQKAGIPKVEEWKKMAAEYKNNSVPLGSVSSSQQSQMQQGMERMSLNGQQQQSFGGHSRQPSNYAYQQQQQQGLYAPERASVPRYIFADDKFHFIVEARLSNGTHWDLQRVYEDFYELQINLINAFPEEAGQVQNKPRTLPYMPGPVKFVTDGISEGRRANLDEYLRDLLALSQKITTSSLVRNFFAPRENDYEVDPNAVDLDIHARPKDPRDRYSAASQGSYQNGAYPQAPQHQRQLSQQSQQQQQGHQYSQSQASVNGGPYGQHQRGMSSQGVNHYRTPSNHGQQQQVPTTSTPSLSSTAPSTTTTTQSTSNNTSAPVKVKAWFDRDTCVVIRMPPRNAFRFSDLHRKIVERRRLEYKGQDQNDEDLDIEYRDEKDGEYYRLEGDEDLEIAVERNEKLTLAVRAAGT